MSDNALHAPQRAARPHSPMHLAPAARGTLRRTLCAAGMAALVAVAVAPAAHADVVGDVPDASWTPDVPSIDGGSTDTGGGDAGGDDAGGAETPDIDPAPPADTGGGDTGGGDTTVTEPEVPDSGSSVPSYDETYGDGSTGSVGAGEGAFFDPAAQAEADAAAAEAPAEAPQEAAGYAVAAPAFTAFDAATNTLTGTAAAGSTVRVVDAAGNVLADVVAGEDGTFSVTLPEGTDLAGVSLYVLGADGAQASDALTGAAVVQAIADQQRAAVRAEVGASTFDLASGLASGLASFGTASSITQPDDGAMPVVPYVLGAASALVAVGAVGGVAVAVRRSVRRRSEGEGLPGDGAYAPDYGAALSVADAPAAGAACAPARPAAADDGLDDLERLALGLASAPAAPAPARPAAPAAGEDVPPAVAAMRGLSPDDTLVRVASGMTAGGPDPDDDPEPPGRGPAPRPDSTDAFLAVAPAPAGAGAAPSAPAAGARADVPPAAGFAPGASPEATLPCAPVQPPVDPAAFAATARILATGSGPVHRVTQRTSDLDLTGLDLFDEAQTPVSPHTAADPLVESGDWRAVALAELASDGSPEAAAPGDPSLSTDGYVALFKTQRNEAACPGADEPPYVAPVVGPSSVSQEEAALHRSMLERASTPEAVALRARDEEFRRQRTQAGALVRRQQDEGVPQIARGPVAGSGDAATPGPAVRPRSVGDRARAASRAWSVPDLEPPAAEVPAGTPASLAAAVSAATAAYAAFAPASARRTASFAPAAPASHAAPAPVAPAPAARAAAYVPRPAAPQAPAAPTLDGLADNPEVAHSVAAAYAAAVYANVQAPAARPAYEPAHRAPAAEAVPAVGSDGAVRPASEDPDPTSALSSAYIAYLVQEEFEHRHDTPAQRNAALGRMRVVNGGAQAPVSIREGLALHRHRA